MTHLQLAPHWTSRDRWTAVVLAVVPTPALPVPAEELTAAVTAAVRSDVIAFDLVTVGLGPIVDGSPEGDDEVAATLLRVAALGGHLVAPRVVFACVIVGGGPKPVDDAADRLSGHSRLRQLNATVHRQVVTGLEQGVVAIGRVVARLLSTAEQQPETAIDEVSYLAGLTEVAGAPAAPVPAGGETRRTTAPPLVHRTHPPAPRRPPLWRRDRYPSRRGEPVLTEPYWLDHLAATAGAAALVQLVLVPDYAAPTRAITDRRRAVALALDDALGRVHRHPTGRELNVALEVLVATSPLTRGTILRPAGVLAADELPMVPLDYFDIYDVVDDLLEAQVRARRALTRRRIEVSSVHLVVLTTTAPLYHDEAAERFDELARGVRITWLQFGPGETLPDEFTRSSADRVSRYRDHADVVSEVMGDVEDLYGEGDPGAGGTPS